MNDVLKFLCSIYPLTAECQAYLRSIIRKRNIKKGQILLKTGEVCRNLYFIQKGVLRCSYYIKDKEVSDWFFWQGETVVAIDSFYDQAPSEDCIQALEDCELFYISFLELEYLYEHYIEFNYIGRVLTLKYLRVFHEHVRNIRRLSATKRCQILLQKYPGLIDRVDLGHLASWLGMTRETLSRVKSKKIKTIPICKD
jgi:CRP-like cAMP-binding protein